MERERERETDAASARSSAACSALQGESTRVCTQGVCSISATEALRKWRFSARGNRLVLRARARLRSYIPTYTRKRIRYDVGILFFLFSLFARVRLCVLAFSDVRSVFLDACN